MSKKSVLLYLSLIMLTAVITFIPSDRACGTGLTIDPWPSFRHDLSNSGAESHQQSAPGKSSMADGQPRIRARS